MNFYDAFCGIGGFRIGLEAAGLTCVGSCEIDEYARQVYHHRFGDWPDKDIREVIDIKGADMLCGGFPCQDISVAGKGAGLSGERSGLWWELARIIENCLPRWVFLENVPALLGRGLGDILGPLAACGYDAEWDCLPASAFGAPHQRDRIWIVAYPMHSGRRELFQQKQELWSDKQTNARCYGKTQSVAYATSSISEGVGTVENREQGRPTNTGWWKAEPDVGRVVDGIPNRTHRLKCLGNAVVPHVVEWIGRRITGEKGELR